MYLTSRNFFLILLILFVTLSPVITGNFGLIDEDDTPDDVKLLIISSISLTWTGILAHQVSGLLRLGVSIFALFVMYLGGRSKNKRFNDRTIDPNNSLTVVFFSRRLC